MNYKARRADIIGTGKELFSITRLEAPNRDEKKKIRIAGDTQSADALVKKFERKMGEKFNVTYQSTDNLERTLKQFIEDKKYNLYFLSNALPLFTGMGV